MSRIWKLATLAELVAATTLTAQTHHAASAQRAGSETNDRARTTRAPAPAAALRPYFLGGIALGYNAGKGVDGTITAAHLFGASPIRLRLALRYAAGNGGDAQAARHAFINDATNGTPEDHGRTWGLKLDLLHPVGILPGHNTQAFFGLRHASFTGNYRLVGANEDFNVMSTNWGVGGGLETMYPVSRAMSVNVTTGLDYFLASRLYGHDTAYTPSGENQVNPRDGFSYADADRAVAQPKFSLIMMVGLQFRL
jgi:hypothetical protein